MNEAIPAPPGPVKRELAFRIAESPAVTGGAPDAGIGLCQIRIAGFAGAA